jgi:hypothetical protein
MTNDGGKLEDIGGSSEKKGRMVGGFVGILLAAIVVGLLLVIGYLAVRKDKTLPPSTEQPRKQSLIISVPSYFNS